MVKKGVFLREKRGGGEDGVEVYGRGNRGSLLQRTILNTTPFKSKKKTASPLGSHQRTKFGKAKNGH